MIWIVLSVLLVHTHSHSLFLLILLGPSARLGMAMVDVSERVIGFLV